MHSVYFAETDTVKCLHRPGIFRSCTLLLAAPIVARRVQHPPVYCGTPNPTQNRTNGRGSTPLGPPNAPEGDAVTAVGVATSRLHSQNANAIAKKVQHDLIKPYGLNRARFSIVHAGAARVGEF